MECWVSKLVEKGVWSSFLEKIKKYVNLKFVEKGQTLEAFFRPDTIKTEIFLTSKKYG